MFRLAPTPHFERRLARFRRLHPELNRRVSQTLRDLERDPHQPHLRLHPLHGELAGTHAVTIAYKYRISLALRMTEREIVLIDIGSHDEVYR